MTQHAKVHCNTWYTVTASNTVVMRRLP